MQIFLPYTIPSILYIYIYIFYTIRNTGGKRFFFSTFQLILPEKMSKTLVRMKIKS